MPSYSRTPTASPTVFAERLLGVQPHPLQVVWLECRAQTKVAAIGRRWGKTFAEAIDLLWFATVHPGTTQFIIAPTADQTTTIFRYAVQMLSQSAIRDTVRKIVQSPFPRIELANGSVINARSAGREGQNVRSHGADRLIVDEAAFVPVPAIEALRPLLANSAYAETVYISSPWGKNHFYDTYMLGDLNTPGYASFRFPSSSSPYVSRAFLESERLSMSGLAFRTEYLAEFADDQNAVFPTDLIARCLADADSSDTAPLPGHRYTVGWDPAKWRDRSGVVVIDVTTLPWRVVLCRDINGQDYLEQWPIVRGIADTYNRAAVLIDSTHNDPLLELAQRDVGGRAEGFSFSNPSKQELISGLVLQMEQDGLRFPHLPLLIEELTYYRYELTASGATKLGADPKHHDDLVTALALAVRMATAAASRPLANRVAVGPPRAILDYQPR